MTTNPEHESMLKSWSDAQVQRRLDATIAYLESDAGWIAGPSVVRMYEAELERRGVAR